MVLPKFRRMKYEQRAGQAAVRVVGTLTHIRIRIRIHTHTRDAVTSRRTRHPNDVLSKSTLTTLRIELVLQSNLFLSDDAVLELDDSGESLRSSYTHALKRFLRGFISIFYFISSTQNRSAASSLSVGRLLATPQEAFHQSKQGKVQKL
ncbi:jg10375 [Pararge aegeria aegeria]|uniref:Jg10375 protein n=1 Tax=Pararge aegeria aegeria TaxID=348720 RepID=A0A8S4SAP7_9NEOP|nr:jg10375 [Pararge aegeria aegeria]